MCVIMPHELCHAERVISTMKPERHSLLPGKLCRTNPFSDNLTAPAWFFHVWILKEKRKFSSL
jgi:hypothetical protein